MSALIDELRERGLLEQITSEPAFRAALEEGEVPLYIGYDPTAESLHLGNLIPIMLMVHFQRAGHSVVGVIGGATGSIGDPSGKDTERPLQTPDVIEKNSASIRSQLERFLDFEGEHAAVLLNNADWIGPMTFIEWLREVGKHFTVNYMIAKESVKRRLEQRDQGITFTEFSYMMLQAYDFYHLYETRGVRAQAGGNDQWGNITAGVDLVHKKSGKQVFGLTAPLLTTASGDKFGKSAGNAVWLDPELTSAYEFYQYWMQTEDADVGRWLKVFTLLPLDEIATIEAEHAEAPFRRQGQKRLAAEVTRVVHGQAGVDLAERASKVLFGGTMEGLTARELSAIFADVPSSERERSELSAGVPVIDLFSETLCASKSEARRLLGQGGVYINNERIEDLETLVKEGHLATPDSMVLRAGKKKYFVVKYA
ncbi:MAG: tyrosyl-tRNA synthetase [Bradymonadia bacterium]|jgi:tyrosyl-tRNA synthetase